MQKILQRLSILMAALAMAGCASTPQGLKDDPQAKRSFTVEGNYQAVLKRLVENRQECRHQPLIPLGQVILDVHHYPELREGSIVEGASGVGTQIYVVITVKGDGQDQTTVTTWTKIRTDEFVEKIKKIVNGERIC